MTTESNHIENTFNSNTPAIGRKDDVSKPDYSLVPPLAQDEFVKVLTFGADKYGRDNWRKLVDLKNRYIAAMGRHTNALMRGELRDPESGLLHTAHIQSCAAFLSEYQLRMENIPKAPWPGM